MDSKNLFHSSDLRKSQSFYSIIGMRWFGGQEIELGDNGLPGHWGDGTAQLGLPHLLGSLGSMEFIFHHDSTLQKSTGKEGSTWLIYYDTADEVSRVLSRLASAGLLEPGFAFDEELNPIVLDPDGRQILLCPPNPYRVP